MALISNPRSIVVPTFHFKEDGSYVENPMFNPCEVDKMFACELMRERTIKFPNPLNSKAFCISLGREFAPVVCRVRRRGTTRLFEQIQLFSEDGDDCDESIYLNLWRNRRRTDLLYLEYERRNGKLQVRAKARLLELIVYLARFEAESLQIMRRLRENALREFVRAHRSDLHANVSLELSEERGALWKQFASDHPLAGEGGRILKRNDSFEPKR